ncbi:DUF397 domain-containing protein [Streptomyces sp. ISL-96]|uniref:DUF397 domain-containing protein n=1 Tax=Streptomyces sp. ISL-96 TaxID=2819191 RepID=UPI001BE8BCAA|nr:DUF397 domain-containing protein [Streptomyces sp. ISL-96]MBT2493982.1 DUF397 domain-containing protein [Streptomyces sp. ISL-96]
MPTLPWQKSSYSGDSSNCLEVVAAETGGIKLRESDDPVVILTATQQELHRLIRGVKTGIFTHRSDHRA